MSNLYVPVDPTDEMLDAAVKATGYPRDLALAIYEAMTTAAPKVEREEHITVLFESTRNGLREDQPRLRGAQGFSTLTKAIDFMIKGLRQGQLFEKMERRETFRSDVSAHLLEVAQAEGIQVEQIRRA